jgi:hypothetical protein
VCGITHGIDIRHTEALLAGSQTRIRRDSFAKKIGLDLHHTGRREQQGRVALRDERRAGNYFVVFTGKEIKVSGADFITGHHIDKILG